MPLGQKKLAVRLRLPAPQLYYTSNYVSAGAAVASSVTCQHRRYHWSPHGQGL